MFVPNVMFNNLEFGRKFPTFAWGYEIFGSAPEIKKGGML